MINEEMLLEETTRKQIIEEIGGSENLSRKNEAYRRHQIWKDRTKDYTRSHLLKLLDASTVSEMEYALANVSIVKKIIDKLARVYSNGVERSFESEAMDRILELTEQLIHPTTCMKTLNKILKLQRNALLYIKPVFQTEDQWRPQWLPLSPYLYDVIEYPNDRTKPMAVILSNFEVPKIDGFNDQAVPERAAHHSIGSVISSRGNSKDEIIADPKEDEDANKKIYIWWSNNYHFTTRGSQIVDPVTLEPFILEEGEQLIDRISNPIEELPFVDMHIDQEGSYWATGGDDLIDGAVLINSMLSNAHHIGVTQGYGQLVVTGSKIPSTVKLGPNKMIGLQHEDSDQPAPSAQFITANPPLGDLQSQIEMYIALILTTNNLSTNGISASLQGGVMAPSGIALAIDKAESLEDVQDQREMFREAEKPAWRKTSKWIQYFRDQSILDEEFQEIVLPEDPPMVEFKEPRMIMSETEMLENIRKRQDMKLNTRLELIMRDRGISREEAEKVLKEILEESIENQMRMGIDPNNNQFEQDEENNEENNEEEDQEEDEGNEDDSQR